MLAYLNAYAPHPGIPGQFAYSFVLVLVLVLVLEQGTIWITITITPRHAQDTLGLNYRNASTTVETRQRSFSN